MVCTTGGISVLGADCPLTVMDICIFVVRQCFARALSSPAAAVPFPRPDVSRVTLVVLSAAVASGGCQKVDISG